ncbi:thymidylate synthase [Neiella marina]|uniref:Thymidylate synthase n=1 Tax=Neiella holothuriorum TaxID=2870530 RepID=A0ABS7EBG8_9GAMM|nr:thymidylate synthase [Neiella holothuriorum]MBW8189678.1 thymidylate synthase [Neiella holothuriorum]
MHILAPTLDDLLYDTFTYVLENGQQIESTKGDNQEVRGCLLTLKNPRSRISRSETKGTIFSCLGELFWYLSGRDDAEMISNYIRKYDSYKEQDGTIHGAYGPRFYGMHGKFDQIRSVIRLLKRKPKTRQAVIQLFDASDIHKQYNDTPCTISLQFMIRDEQLHMFTNMRSNDAYRGLPHDIFVFSMIQEIIAKVLGYELGEYNHFVSSLHVYDCDLPNIRAFLSEGFMPSKPIMPPMPESNFGQTKATLLELEEAVRTNPFSNIEDSDLPSYWLDMIRLLRYYHLSKLEDPRTTLEMEICLSHIKNRDYEAFIERRRARLEEECS